jgi:hypothetical protein
VPLTMPSSVSFSLYVGTVQLASRSIAGPTGKGRRGSKETRRKVAYFFFYSGAVGAVGVSRWLGACSEVNAG